MEDQVQVKKISAGNVVGVVVLFLALGFAGYQWYRTVNELKETKTLFAERTAQYESTLADIQGKLASTTSALATEQYKNNLFEGQIRSLGATVGELGGTIGTLEKLSKTDPELLQKYSKIFFLSENYVPERLGSIDKKYLYSEDRPEQIEERILTYLEKLFAAAERDEVKLYVKSAYRSFGEQKVLKSAYSVTYGAGMANQFSAEQGYSEHQLGTTVDFISTGQGGELSGFDKTAAYKWLEENAHTYGFTLSYPKGNAYYTYEPWHWRFVGASLATRLKNENIHFYNLEQREIDKYLVNIFD